jgi:hypothetical protein
LALTVTGANRHDVTQLGPVLDAMVIASTDKGASFLYADKGYAGEPAQEVLTCRGSMGRNASEAVPGRIGVGLLKRLTPGSTVSGSSW